MGIALRMSERGFEVVDLYYARSKREPTKRGDLDISSVGTFKPNFLDLARMLLDKQQSHVVVVAHGTSGGFTMPVTDKTSVSADNTTLAKLLALVLKMPSVDAAARSDFATYCSITEAEVDALVKTCHKVRMHESCCFAVHVRGCNIGKNKDNLDTLRSLFNSTVVSAPNVPMLYSTLAPKWHRNPDLDVEKWKRDNKPATRRRDFSASGRSAFVVDADYAGVSSNTQGAIARIADLPAYATEIYGHANHGVTTGLTVAAMWTDKSYALPHESAYTDAIVASRSP